MVALLSFQRKGAEDDKSPDLDKELLDSDLPLQTHTPGSPNCLLFQSWVQSWLQNEDIVGRGEVDAHAAATHGQQEHRGGRILLKCLYCLHTSTLSTGRLWWADPSEMPLLPAHQQGRCA